MVKCLVRPFADVLLVSDNKIEHPLNNSRHFFRMSDGDTTVYPWDPVSATPPGLPKTRSVWLEIYICPE